tara:strand:- start:284 stop:448 length:165 start_codon:yes stop_codon:yes gene_type:complete
MSKDRILEVGALVRAWREDVGITTKEALFALYDDRDISGEELYYLLAPIMGMQY